MIQNFCSEQKKKIGIILKDLNISQQYSLSEVGLNSSLVQMGNNEAQSFYFSIE